MDAFCFADMDLQTPLLKVLLIYSYISLMFYNYKVYRFYEFSATKNGADYAFLSAFGSDKKERLHSRRTMASTSYRYMKHSYFMCL